MKSFRNAPCSAGSAGSLVVKYARTSGSVKTGSVSYLTNKKMYWTFKKRDLDPTHIPSNLFLYPRFNQPER